jgi:hypothetical protein
MSSPSTIPFTASKPSPSPWSPTSRDRLIFNWVKFDGHTQAWVGTQLGLDQSTVSRIIQRYERWVAHGGPNQECLTRGEQLRAQRWLTYERNEWILASALRIAGEMERNFDATKTTHVRLKSESPAHDVEVRTENKVVDRSGIACRFLRLAYRINMEQLALIESDDLAPLDPLTSADLDPTSTIADDHEGFNPNAPLSVVPAQAELVPAQAELQSTSAASAIDSAPVSAAVSAAPSDAVPCSTTPPAPHNPPAQKPPRTTAAPTTSDENQSAKKPICIAYPVACHPPETTDYRPANHFTLPLGFP